jgi:putative ABC transport system substrate-binding protein
MWYSSVGCIVTLTLSLLAAPLAVEAQPSAHVPRIGLLSIFAPAVGQSKAENFREGLREVGYMEGKNILIETRWAEGHRERFAELAADLVRLQVAVLVTDTTH